MTAVQNFRRIPIMILVLAAGLSPLSATAQTTTWIVGMGDWGTASNWSNGEPTAATDAEMGATGTTIVSLQGEVCRNFTTESVGNTLRIQGGALSVGQRLHIGGGAVQQFSGSVTANELILGDSASAATYIMSAGTLTLGSARIGGVTSSSGTFSTTANNPQCMITGPLHVDKGGSFGFGAGTLSVGTTGIHVEGAFLVNNRPTMSTTTFTLTQTSSLMITIGPFGVTPIVATGAVTLDGQFFAYDVLAENGTYEILRGNPLQGTFDSVSLQTNWSWRIEGNSLFVTKGPVAVEATTWSGIKAGYGS